MNYFFDTEFLEGPQDKKNIFGLRNGKTKPTIDLISIGIVSEDGREFYAVSKDFNLDEAWNRFDWKRKTVDDGIPGAYKQYWIRDNVLKQVWRELYYLAILDEGITQHQGVLTKNAILLGHYDIYFSFESLKSLISRFGKTNAEISESVKRFVFQTNLDDAISKNQDSDIKFYAYYADYDWVAFCWLFGNMMALPKGFPMYCRDLKQMLDEKVESKSWTYGRDVWSNKNRSVSNVGTGDYQEKDRLATFDEKLELAKELIEYPTQENEHNALDDAKWNKKLFDFIKSL